MGWKLIVRSLYNSLDPCKKTNCEFEQLNENDAMKVIIFILFWFAGSGLYAQGTEKGVVPATTNKLKSTGVTRAVVVGISEYLTPEIPNLKYADKDAIAFTNWLQSPAGGSVPVQNIQLYTNGDATEGAIATAIWGLMDSSKMGDRAIIYLSGHGDVEGKKQKGYFLAHDSPSGIYMSGGAIRLRDLAELINEMSENGVQVILISDACRSGAFAGSDFGGPQATVSQLETYLDNQILLLSCQHHEYSLEGEQWGGGRGLFSYQLENALYGLADQDQDLHIELRELRNYLETTVMKAAEPNRQTPIIDGPITTQICAVDPPSLADFQMRGKGDPKDFMDTDGRAAYHFPDTILYAHFIAAIEADKLLNPAGESANDYYNQMINDPIWEPYYGHIKRKFVAALTKEAQIAINRLLKTDPRMVDEAFQGRVRFVHLPAYLNRACEILGEQHYLYPYLRAKQYYFEAKTYTNKQYPDLSTDSLTQLSLSAINIGLSYDTGAAYLYLEKGGIYNWKLVNHKESIQEFKKALDLSPTWVLANFYYGMLLSVTDQQDSSIQYIKQAMKYDSTFLPNYERLGWYSKTEEEKRFWREEYVKRMYDLIENDPDNIPATYYRYMGLCLQSLNQLEEAEKFLLKGAEMSNYEEPLYYRQLAGLYQEQGRFADAWQMLQKYLALNPRGYRTLDSFRFTDLMLPNKYLGKFIEDHDLELEYEKNWACIMHYFYYLNHDFENSRKTGLEHLQYERDGIVKQVRSKINSAHGFWYYGDPAEAEEIVKEYVAGIESGNNEKAKDSLKLNGGPYGQLVIYNLAQGDVDEAEYWFKKKGGEDEFCFSNCGLYDGWGFGLKTWLAYTRGRYGDADSLIKGYIDRYDELLITEDMLQLVSTDFKLVDYAIFTFETALKYKQPTPDLYYHLGRLYIDQKEDYTHGLPLLEQANKLYPWHFNFAYHLSAAYAHFKRTDEALNLLEKAMDNGYDYFEDLAADVRWDYLRDTARFKQLLKKYDQ